MRKVFLVLFLVAGLAVSAFGRNVESLTLQAGQKKTGTRSKIAIKFISVTEDSRCPRNVMCIWAGNARIQIAVSKGKKAPQVFELNSMLKPQSIVFEGYEIKFGSLTPYPGQDTVSLPTPIATVSITKTSK